MKTAFPRLYAVFLVRTLISACPLVAFLISIIIPVSFQVEVMKQAHIRGLLKAFLVPTRSMLQTQRQAEEQASKFPLFLCIEVYSPCLSVIIATNHVFLLQRLQTVPLA